MFCFQNARDLMDAQTMRDKRLKTPLPEELTRCKKKTNVSPAERRKYPTVCPPIKGKARKRVNAKRSICSNGRSFPTRENDLRYQSRRSIWPNVVLPTGSGSENSDVDHFHLDVTDDDIKTYPSDSLILENKGDAKCRYFTDSSYCTSKGMPQVGKPVARKTPAMAGNQWVKGSADRKVRRSRKQRIARIVDSVKRSHGDANESANSPDNDQSNKGKPQERKSSTPSEINLVVKPTKSTKGKYHELCHVSIYPVIPKALTFDKKTQPEWTAESKESKRSTSPSVRVRMPTSKFHQVCLYPRISKRSTQEGRPVPYGGPDHPYICPKRKVSNLYESRMAEKARLSDYRSKVKTFLKTFCMRCNAIYDDGICRQELGCKSYKGKKVRQRGVEKGKQRHMMDMEHLCSCNHQKEINPQEVEESSPRTSGDGNLAIQSDSQNQTKSYIVIRQISSVPRNAQFIKLLIVSLDMIAVQVEKKLSASLSRPGSLSGQGADTYQLETASRPVVGIPGTADASENALEQPEPQGQSASSVSLMRHTVTTEERRGLQGQYLRVKAKEVNISVFYSSGLYVLTNNVNQVKTAETPTQWNDISKEFGCPAILKNRMVTDACFCPADSTLVLTLHTKIEHNHGTLPCKLLCVWNTDNVHRPYRILEEVENLTCMCFSPISGSYAFAGMMDGSIVLWKIDDPGLNSSIIKVKTDTFISYKPNYRTSHTDGDSGHTSCVLSIAGIQPHTETGNSTAKITSSAGEISEKIFKLAAVEARGIIIIWQVERVARMTSGMPSSPSLSGSNTNLRMVKDLQVSLIHMASDIKPKNSMGTLILQLNTVVKQSKNATTEMGTGAPNDYSTIGVQNHTGASIGKSTQVQCVDFSPFNSVFFLAGYRDGRVFLCHVEIREPILCFLPVDHSQKPVVKVEWSQSRPTVFFVLIKDSHLKIYDLCQDKQDPIHIIKCAEGAFSTMALSSYLRSAFASLYLLLSSTNGSTVLHTLSNAITVPKDDAESKVLNELADGAASALPPLPLSTSRVSEDDMLI